MKLKIQSLALVITALLLGQLSTKPQRHASDSIQSRTIKAGNGDLVLEQVFEVGAPISEVWKAYTTDAGYSAWAAPQAHVDLRAGGSILAHYNPQAELGDKGTITLHIVNYVPERLLTLRAELGENWPDIMKEDHENLMEITHFEPLGENLTRVSSYGVGYRDKPAYNEILEFFIPANESLYRKLKNLLDE